MNGNLFTPRLFMLVAAGGLLGTFSRFGLQLLLQSRPGGFPWGTVAVNLLGCAIFGFVAQRLQISNPADAQLRVALTVGFCGAFTTMSSFSFELVELASAGRWSAAGLYGSLSLVGSMAAMVGGLALGRS